MCVCVCARVRLCVFAHTRVYLCVFVIVEVLQLILYYSSLLHVVIRIRMGLGLVGLVINARRACARGLL